jgi:ribosomal protein S18 acetylase RimI-like enzyme
VNNVELVIRPFRTEDMDPLYFLDQRCAAPGERPAYGRLLTALLEEEALAVVAAEGSEGQPEPLRGALIARREPGRSALGVLVLIVDPSSRRLGIARRLLGWAMRLGLSQGLREIAAIQEDERAETLAFLHAMGFRRTEEVAPGFRLPEPRPRWTLPLAELGDPVQGASAAPVTP